MVGELERIKESQEYLHLSEVERLPKEIGRRTEAGRLPKEIGGLTEAERLPKEIGGKTEAERLPKEIGRQTDAEKQQKESNGKNEKTADEKESGGNNNTIESKNDSDDTVSSEKGSDKNDISEDNEVTVRDLTEEEKQKLREAGMSESNIANCKIDQNGKVHLKTTNSSMEGKTHPETGVKYVRKTIELNRIKVEGVFPDFNTIFECDLPEDLLTASDDDQFKECMKRIKEAIKDDPELAAKFTDRQLERIMKNDNQARIPGYTWHHNEETGKMELVKDAEHQKSGHTGGRTMWGGGQENR